MLYVPATRLNVSLLACLSWWCQLHTGRYDAGGILMVP